MYDDPEHDAAPYPIAKTADHVHDGVAGAGEHRLQDACAQPQGRKSAGRTGEGTRYR
jgi:hypothetical protein